MSYFVGIKSFYWLRSTSQHRVHQVHKYQSHITFSQFIHLLKVSIQNRFHMYFSKTYWNTTDKVPMSTLLPLACFSLHTLLLLLPLLLLTSNFNLMPKGSNSIYLYIYYDNKHILWNEHTNSKSCN